MLFRTLACAAFAGAALGGTSASGETLDEAIAAGLAHSPTLAAAEARESAADAAIAQARAQRMPAATIQGQAGLGWIDPQGFFGLSADDVAPRTLGLGVDWPIFTGGRVAAADRQAAQGRQAAAAARDQAMLAVRIAVVAAYADAIAARRAGDSHAALVAALGEIVRHAELKFVAGDGTSTEIAQAKARKAEAEADLAAARGRLKMALARLAILAGRPLTVEDGLPPPPATPATVDDTVALALANNPALAQARSSAGMSEAAVAAARAEARPTVSLYADGASTRDQFFPGYKADSASIGIRAKWTFFDGGRVGAAVDRASADARAAGAEAEAVAQDVERRAIESFIALDSARARLVAAEARRSAIDEALRGTRLEVQAGARPQLALLDAEREAVAASSAQIDAEVQVLVAAYVLRAVTGTT